MPSTLSLIVAMSENRVIGKANSIPWSIPGELKHFKELTTENIVIMGRKTFESIGRPLPNRTNLIVSKNAQFDAKGCSVFSTFEAALSEARKLDRPIFIGGGETLYRQALLLCDSLYVTTVHCLVEGGDTYFPELPAGVFTEVSAERVAAVIDYTRRVYKRG